MENLFKIKTLLIIILAIASIQGMQSQNDLFVFRFSGQPFIKVNDSIRPLTKGTALSQSTSLIMNRDDILQFIDEQGNLFQLVSTGKFSQKELLKIPAMKNNSSITQKSFSWLWKEFTNNMALRNNKSGVVYRGDYLNLIGPLNNVDVYSSEITFEWEAKENKKNAYYFLLRDTETNIVTKIGTVTNSVTLFIDNSLIKYGKSYEWAVVETKFPSLKKLEFNRFNVRTQKDFEELETEIASISRLLNDIGLDDQEIKDIMCVDFKKCFN